MTDLFGRRLGNYEILSLLGEGGMAAVYRARQSNIRREVAIKVIKPAYIALDDDKRLEFIRRFEREAQTVGTLDHPHILKIFDYGDQDNIVYLVMELKTGGSLGQKLDAYARNLPACAKVIDQLASALDYAHRQGIIHRDLKPQNVLFDGDGNAVLTDFGIAKVMSDVTSLTQSGMAMGTPAYMSPEAWRGEQLDARADIYSFGVMVYEMLAGKLPFQGDTPYALMHMHTQQTPPSLLHNRPDLPQPIESVLMKALAKDRNTRFATAGDFAAAFKIAITGQMPSEVEVASGRTPSAEADMNALTAPIPTPGGVIRAAHPLGMPTGSVAAGRRGNSALLVIGLLAIVGLIAAIALVSGGGQAAVSITPTALVVVLTDTESPPPTLTSSAIPSPFPSETPNRTATDEARQTEITSGIILNLTGTASAMPTSTNTPLISMTLTSAMRRTSVAASVTAAAALAATAEIRATRRVEVAQTQVALQTQLAQTQAQTHVAETQIAADSLSTAQARETAVLAAVQTQTAVASAPQVGDVSAYVYTGSLGGVIRTAPNAYAERIVILNERTRLTVTGLTADKTYYRIEYRGQQGWLSKVYVVQEAGDFANLPVITVESSGGTAYVYTGSLGGVIRTAPNAYAERLVILQERTRLTVTAVTADRSYFRVEYRGQQGWLSKVYVAQEAGDFANLPVITVESSGGTAYVYTGSLGGVIRAAPNAYAERLVILNERTRLTVTAVTADRSYFRVEYRGQQGWLSKVYVAQEAGDFSRVPVVN